ncbi:MAG TPA: hypothetical protein VE713_19895 [Pyrinomonadaceae bacterium]|nr:hypothetical protein [Pyrinomonadaceae bacterium]
MSRRACLFLLALCLAATSSVARAQQPQAQPGKAPAKGASASKNSAAKSAAPDPAAEMRRATAVSLVNTLADDARMFRDPVLRARVQARAADALWETDRERALTLFRRAWDEAEAADAETDRRVAEERERQMRERGTFSIQTPPSMRTEILRLASRRDRALGEEFLTKLDEARKRESENAATSNERQPDSAQGSQRRPDPMETPPAVSKRLRLAIQLLQDGDAERALQFADPALGAVTVPALEFLARLREKNKQAADERYLALVNRAALDPASDPNTASLLSAYVFTPWLFTTFGAEGGVNSTSWSRPLPAPADISPQLRAAYLGAAASILLRPTPPPELDRTSTGRPGWYMVIKRLLPLFDQFAPDRSPALNAKLASLAPDTPEDMRQPGNNAVTRGIVPEDPNRDRVQDALNRLEQAKTSEQRDAVYVDAVFSALQKKDPLLQELLEKIEDTDLRQRVRAYVDFEAVRAAVNDKDVNEVLRLARGGSLTSIQRAWALTEAARLLSKSDAARAVELLDEALKEAKEHIDDAAPERASALVAIATQLFDLDRPRAWDVMFQVVRASNAAKEYTGEDGRLSTRLQTKNMTMMTSSGAESFDLNGIFAKLAREDLQRAIDLARTFEGESPRAIATLAVARAVLDKGEKK